MSSSHVNGAALPQIEDQLETLIETLRCGIIMLEDYKSENQDSLWTKMCVVIYNGII